MAQPFLHRLREIGESGGVELLANRYSQLLDPNWLQIEVALNYSAETQTVRDAIYQAVLDAHAAAVAIDLLLTGEGVTVGSIPQVRAAGGPVRINVAAALLDQQTGEIRERHFELDIARGDTLAVILQEIQHLADLRYSGQEQVGRFRYEPEALPVVVGFTTYSAIRG